MTVPPHDDQDDLVEVDVDDDLPDVLPDVGERTGTHEVDPPVTLDE